jgi:cation transport regulator ChaB
MPYARNSEMPASITDNVPDAGQSIMRNVINSQLARGLSETRAFASAWAALSRAGYSRGEGGKWVKGSSPGSDSETDKMSPTPSAVHVPSTDWNRDRRRRTRKELSASARQSLENKVTEHNAEHGDKGRVSLPMLEQVYNRGVGAYRTNPESVRPSVNSPEQWAMARVNNFLRTIRTGRFRSGKHDTDLLPSKHPLSTRKARTEGVEKAEYQGRDVELDRPFRLPSGSSKKFGVYVKDGDKVRRVTFGSPDMEIRRDDPEARANFRARHSCDTATDKTSARYWSCRMWEPGESVSEILSKVAGSEDEVMTETETTKRQIVEDVYTTPAEAVTRALELGFSDGAIHVHNTADGTAAYMPGPDHEAYNKAVEARAGIIDNGADEYSDDLESEEREHSMSGRVANLLESIASLMKSDVSDSGGVFFRQDAPQYNGQGEGMESVGVKLSGTILKADDDERIVWGWASVVTEKGVPVVDKQGDVISPEEISKAATEFMLDVRVAKAMHDGEQIGHVVHSFPLTNELAKALGIQSEREGWIIAQKITDDETWARVKSGELSAFSIGGNAITEAYEDGTEGSDDA